MSRWYDGDEGHQRKQMKAEIARLTAERDRLRKELKRIKVITHPGNWPACITMSKEQKAGQIYQLARDALDDYCKSQGHYGHMENRQAKQEATMSNKIEAIEVGEFHACCTGDCDHDRVHDCQYALESHIQELTKEGKSLIAERDDAKKLAAKLSNDRDTLHRELTAKNKVIDAAWDDEWKSCGEISCDECTERYTMLRRRCEKAEAERDDYKELARRVGAIAAERDQLRDNIDQRWIDAYQELQEMTAERDRLRAAAEIVVRCAEDRVNEGSTGEPYDAIANPGQFFDEIVALAKALADTGGDEADRRNYTTTTLGE